MRKRMGLWLALLSMTVLGLVGVGRAQQIGYTPPSSSGGGGVWGTITGTLSNQSDLDTALDGKAGECSSNGIMVRTAANTCTARQVTNTGGGLTLSNPTLEAGNLDISLDRAVNAFFSTGTGAVPGTGSTGDWYYKTDTNDPYTYTSTNTPKLVLAPDTTATLTNKTFDANGTGNSLSNVDVADLADGTDGELITWDASGNADTVAAGTSGHVLTSNGAGAAPTFQAAAGGSSFDPSTTLRVYDDFITGDGITSGRMGTEGFRTGTFDSGSLAMQGGSSVNPGLVRLKSHATTDNSGAYIAVTNTMAGDLMGTTWEEEDWEADIVIEPGSNGTSIASAYLFFGLLNYNNQGTDGPDFIGSVGVRYDTDLSDSTYIFVVCSTSTNGCGSAGDNTNQKVEASTVSPSAGTMNRLRIRHLMSGVGGNETLYFSVDDETEVTFCSSGCSDTLGTYPTGISLALRASYTTRTTTGVMSADVDYIYLTMTGLSRY